LYKQIKVQNLANTTSPLVHGKYDSDWLQGWLQEPPNFKILSHLQSLDSHVRR